MIGYMVPSDFVVGVRTYKAMRGFVVVWVVGSMKGGVLPRVVFPMLLPLFQLLVRLYVIAPA